MTCKFWPNVHELFGKYNTQLNFAPEGLIEKSDFHKAIQKIHSPGFPGFFVKD
jgi:hypothetical protein